jgi:secreted trypsin-like serine protease
MDHPSANRIRAVDFTAMRWSSLLLFTAATACAAPSNDELEAVDESESSIIGGTATTKYAAVGALVENGEPFCTGTVIAPRIVLTAAHCLVGLRAANVRFTLGASAYAPTKKLKVARLRPHPAFDDAEGQHDIGIVELAEDAGVAPIPRNTTKLDSSWLGKSVTFVGYGVTNASTGAGVGTKRSVVMPITDIQPTEFVYEKTGANTCSGDSGGPALAKNAAGVTVVIGVTSWGDDLCKDFGVDTRVDAYRTFIGQSLQ